MANDNELKGLGGWLILVALGLVVSPIRILLTTLQTFLPIFQDNSWATLTTPGSPAYNAFWAPLLIGEIVFNALLCGAYLYLIYLFFTKHCLFPKIYIATLAVAVVFIPLDAWLVSMIMPNEPVFDPDTAKEFGRSLVAALIWIPYMLVSKRVRATFVEGGRGEPAPAEQNPG